MFAQMPGVLSLPFLQTLDEDIKATVGDRTLNRYRQSLGGLVSFLRKHNLVVHNLSEIDAAAILYKNHVPLTRSQIDYLISSLEFSFPALKNHKLPYLKRVAAGRARTFRTCHTIPLTSKVCRYYCACMCIASKQTRMGFALVFQQALGLRPGELRALLPEHVLVPHAGIGNYVIRLGALVGTKVHREQFVILNSFEFMDVAFVLLMLLRSTKPGSLLFPFSYYQYNRGIKEVERLLGITIGGTPHGARAGMASEAAANGMDVPTIMAKGRWGTETSMKSYIDVIVASQVSAMVSLAAHQNAIDKACPLFFSLFSCRSFCAEAGNNACDEGHGEGREGMVAKSPCGASALPGVESFAAFSDRHSKETAARAGATRISGLADGDGAELLGSRPKLRGASADGAPEKGSGKGRSRLIKPKGFL